MRPALRITTCLSPCFVKRSSVSRLCNSDIVSNKDREFFKMVARRRAENREAAIQCIISKMKSRIGDKQSGRIDVHNDGIDEEIERKVRSLVGEVKITHNKLNVCQYTTYTVEW